MNVLLVAEGEHELGRDAAEGALAVLCRKLGLDGQAIFTRKKVASREVRANIRPGRNGGWKKRALAWIEYAQDQGFDALVLVIDQDRDFDRKAQLDAAQSDGRRSLPRAFGVAIRTFDAWMIADEQALSNVLGRTITRQAEPEDIADSKGIAEGFRDAAESTLGLTELYARVAHEASIAVIESRCPKGFGPFAGRVRAIAT